DAHQPRGRALADRRWPGVATGRRERRRLLARRQEHDERENDRQREARRHRWDPSAPHPRGRSCSAVDVRARVILLALLLVGCALVAAGLLAAALLATPLARVRREDRVVAGVSLGAQR